MPKKYLTAREAAEKLGISRATLYSYVSRGLIRSQSESENHRSRRYVAADVDRLIARKAGRRNPEHAARTALNWGAPVLESALTLIQDQRLFYRGVDVRDLVVQAHFEEVVGLLWTGELKAVRSAERQPAAVPPIPDYLPIIQRLQVALALSDDLGAYNLEPRAVMSTGIRILDVMTTALTGTSDLGSSIAERLAAHWSPDQPAAVPLLDTALILCADHELNASSFAARVIASTAATPYAAVIGGLSALSGLRHGALTERAAALLAQLNSPADAQQLVREYLQRGERIPGFGHRLYPQGDPRAAILLQRISDMLPDTPVLPVIHALSAVMASVVDRAPNIDIMLAVLTQALNLPRGAALAVFALGRTAGWIAHTLEQYSTGQIIRPRAVYTGETPPPETDG